MKFLKELIKEPYWVIALIFGAGLILLPCLTLEKDRRWTTHPPDTLWLPVTGALLLGLSAAAFWLNLTRNRLAATPPPGASPEELLVKEENGLLSIKVGKCEISVGYGRLERWPIADHSAVVLPCNEYFDDACARDPGSALGAYVQRNFDGQADEFLLAMHEHCTRAFGCGNEQQKTDRERAVSFGVGRCLLIERPLGRPTPVALISTTTQRADEALTARIVYLFEGINSLLTRLANTPRINQIVMPLIGAGHGSIDDRLSLLAIILALVDATQNRRGGQMLRKATIVVFRENEASDPAVTAATVRHVLALVASASKSDAAHA